MSLFTQQGFIEREVVPGSILGAVSTSPGQGVEVHTAGQVRAANSVTIFTLPLGIDLTFPSRLFQFPVRQRAQENVAWEWDVSWGLGGFPAPQHTLRL